LDERRASCPRRETAGEQVMTDAKPRFTGRALFVDGVTRDVYEDADGRQWVTAYDGERVYGVWLLPPDERVVVPTHA
jgi:hypothetical protein